MGSDSVKDGYASFRAQNKMGLLALEVNMKDKTASKYHMF